MFETISTLLCAADIYDMPHPIPDEFRYIVVTLWEGGRLVFHSGYMTRTVADRVAEAVNGLVLTIDLAQADRDCKADRKEDY